MLAVKYLNDFTINWLKIVKASPWLLITILLLSIPIAALFNFSLIKQAVLSHSIQSQDFEGTVNQIAIKGKKTKYSAIELYLANTIESNFGFDIIYERSTKVPVGEQRQNQHSINVSFITHSFSKLNWQAYIGDLNRLFTADKRKENLVAISYDYWVHKLQKKTDVIGSTLYIKDNVFEVVAVLPPLLERLRKNNKLNILLPYSISERLLNTDITSIGPDVYTYIVHSTKLGKVEKKELKQFLLEDAYIFREDELVVSEAIGIQIAEYETVLYRIKILELLFRVLLLFCLVAFFATYAASTNSRLQEREIRKLFGASKQILFAQTAWEVFLTALLSSAFVTTIVLLLGLWASQIFGDLGFNFYDELIESIVIFLVFYIALFSILIITLTVVQQSGLSVHIGRGASLSLGFKAQGYILMVVMCVAAAFSLFISTLLYKSISELSHVDIGFNPENVYVITTKPPLNLKSKYMANKNNRLYLQYAETLLGQDSFSSTMSPPMSQRVSYSIWLTSSKKSIGSGAKTSIESDTIWPNYFDIMSINFLQGRSLNWDKDSEVIVSESLWKDYFEGSSLLSSHLLRPTNQGYQKYKVVGVVTDVFTEGADHPPPYKVYTLMNTTTGLESFLLKSKLELVHLREKLDQLFSQMGLINKKIEIKALSKLIDKRQAPMKAQFYISNLITLLVLIACLVFSFSVVGQILDTDAREIALRLSIGASVYRIVIDELKILFAVAIPMLALSVLFITLYKSDISAFLLNISEFNGTYFIYYSLCLIITLVMFIGHRVYKLKQKTWSHLT